jgi:hypothetical protein
MSIHYSGTVVDRYNISIFRLYNITYSTSSKRNRVDIEEYIVSFAIIKSLVLFCTHRHINLKTYIVFIAIMRKNITAVFIFYLYNYKVTRDRERDGMKKKTVVGRMERSFCSHSHKQLRIK